MRYFIAALIIAASPTLAQSRSPITDKTSCLSHLDQAISLAQGHSRGDHPSVLSYQDQMLSEIKDRERADAIMSAYERIGEQYEIIANELLGLCAAYE